MNSGLGLHKIKNPFLLDVTLSKRKKVFLKKAIELAVLCDLNICVLIQDDSKRNKVTHFMSDENLDINEFFTGKQRREFFTADDYKALGGITCDDVLKTKNQVQNEAKKAAA